MTTTEGKRALKNFKLFAGDKVLWIILATLAMFSILVVYSTSAKTGYVPNARITATQALIQQFKYLGFAAIVLIVMHHGSCNFYRRMSLPAFAFFLLLTFGAYLTDKSTNGAARWIFGIQPSEALKVFTVLFLARQLAARQAVISRLRIVPSLNPLKWFRDPAQQRIWREGTIPILLPVVLACGVIFTAHTSSALLVFGISMVMMFVGRVKGTELLKIMALAVAAGALLVSLNLGRTGIAGGRVSEWIDLWYKDFTTVDVNSLPDTERAMIAIQEGGLFGRGAGRSAMRVQMTHPECDYAFAFFIEEYGALLALVVMVFYLWITVRGIVIFTRCETAFPGLVVLGMVLLITLQALLHIMVSVNIMPETGQNLPFVSRGGSSLIFSTAAMAIVLAVSRQNDEKSHDKPRGQSIVE